MFTINLEKELLKQRSDVIEGQELFLNRMKGHMVNKYRHLENSKMVIEKFDSKKVFHISQIEKLCHKYNLRFLKLEYYNAVFPREALQKIKDTKYFYIALPAEAFNLILPKDPLLFCAIGDDNYLMVHKWGNDLSIFRRLRAILPNFALMLPAGIGFYWALWGYIPYPHISKTVILVILTLLTQLGTIALFLEKRKNNRKEWNRSFKGKVLFANDTRGRTGNGN